MIDLESRLRGLAELEPGPVDPADLAAGARRHAARRRRRAVVSAWAAIVIAVATVGAVQLTGRDRAVPARPEPVPTQVTAAELCSQPAPKWGQSQDGPLDTVFAAAALCPAEPASPEWAELPADPVLRGAALKYLITDTGGPPTNGCRFSSPFAPFHIALRRPTGEIVYVDPNRGDACGGRYLAQSFYLALGEQEQLLEPTKASGSREACDPLQTPTEPEVTGSIPASDAVRDVVVCIRPEWAPVDVEAVPRYRPVLRWSPPADQQAALVDALRGASIAKTPLARCPWNGATLVVQLTGADGRTAHANLFCDSLQSNPGAIRWLRLAAPAQQGLLAAKEAWRAGAGDVAPSPPSPAPKEELLVGARTSPLLSSDKLCDHPNPAFSRDGEHLVAACDDLTFVIEPPSTEPRIVAGGADDAAWTTDGTHIVLAHGRSLEIITVSGPTQAPRKIALPSEWYVTSIDLDARNHALLGGEINSRSAVMTIDLDGTHAHVVSTRADVTIYLPRWSPDSTRIGFLQNNVPPTDVDFADVGAWTMAADGSDLRLVLQFGHMAFLGGVPGFDWSPHGWIAFTTTFPTEADGAMGVVVVDPNGRRNSAARGNGALAWRLSAGP